MDKRMGGGRLSVKSMVVIYIVDSYGIVCVFVLTNILYPVMYKREAAR